MPCLPSDALDVLDHPPSVSPKEGVAEKIEGFFSSHKVTLSLMFAGLFETAVPTACLPQYSKRIKRDAKQPFYIKDSPMQKW